MMLDYRVLLIGGTSHAGKSTLAQTLADRLGWSCLSTDTLARHPGRPWQVPPRTVPEHVVAHYQNLSLDELIVDVLRHYRQNVWPLIEHIVTTRATDLSTQPLVLEGSAILPDCVAALPFQNVAAVWLTADRDLLAQRMRAESQYATKSPSEKALIDKFLLRAERVNDLTLEDVNRLGLNSLVVDDASDLDGLVATCRALINR